MEEYQEEQPSTQQQNRDRWADIRSQINRPLMVALVALLAFFVMSAAYGLHQRATVRDLRAQSTATAQSMAQLQSQVNALTAQLQSMAQAAQAQAPRQTAAEQETAPDAPATATEPSVQPATPVPVVKSNPTKKHAAKRGSTTDKRYAQLQAQLAEQGKELKDTQQQMERYRSDLEGNITTTRTELSGEIAKNHDELLLLEKKGERNYYEFELTKSKQFQRVGPLSLSLRKTDTRHKSYDFSMLVDDNELGKKKVNLYEPVLIHTENGAQPVQIVVNHIDKNLVRGYISAPKYKQTELTPAVAPATSPAAGTSPTSAHEAVATTEHPQ